MYIIQSDFNVTDVYHKSEEIQKVVRLEELSWQITHITFVTGGYFLPHRDLARYRENQ